MTSFRFAASVSLVLTAATLYTACSDSSADGPNGDGGDGNVAGESNGGSPPESEGAAAGRSENAGQPSEGGSTSEAMGGAGGTSGAGDVAGSGGESSTPLPEGPCTYTTTGGATLPPTGAQFLCTATSRVFQDNGEGEYTALFGGGFYLDGSNDSSTLGCSVSSAVAPAAGDIWEIGADHTGQCELSSQEGATTNLWKASDQPALGNAKIEFVSATLTHGSTDPSDVYYLCTIKLTGTLAGETGAADVDISGSFEVKLPLGA
jgi:hypothetical protein